jgi:integrase
MLTAAAIEKFRPQRKRREIRDGGAQGLYLVIQPSGARSWALRFRKPNGDPAKLTLGPVDLSGGVTEVPVIGMPLTLTAARALATEVHRQRALDRDVVADHKAERHRRSIAVEEGAANTYAALARRYIDEHAHPRTRRWRETSRLLGFIYPRDGGEPTITKGGLAERWHDRPVREIDSHDIWTVTDEARKLGVPGIEARNDGVSEARARALFSALSSMFGWLRRQRRIEINPCTGVDRPSPPAARERVLTPAEVRWLWRACDHVDAPRVPGAPRPFGVVFRLLLLTGARLNEVAGLRREELAEDGTWHIPGHRTKNHRPHVVPLPPLAREIIAGVKSKPGKAGLVFTTTGETAPSGWSRMKDRLDALMLAVARKEAKAAGRDAADVRLADWRLHDLRRTAVTGMAELDIRPDVIELAVNHISGIRGGIAGTYNRSELMKERRAALERWAAHVQGIVADKPTNVVQMRRGRKRR